MTFDAKVPELLKETQKWFASIITRPIDIENNILQMAPSGISIEEEAKKFIVPSPTLKPFERIQIYNQQYWWRLLSVMHENFPFTTRLFGYYSFNQEIVFPYLEENPPSHWSLNFLGHSLSTWVLKNYLKEDKGLVYDAITLDYAYSISFFAEKKRPLHFQEALAEGFSEIKLHLQPHVHLFEFDYDLFKFRFDMLKEEPDYWVENDFPELIKGKYYFIMFRNHENFVTADTIEPIAFQILKLFEKGASVDEVCEYIETLDEKESEEAASKLQGWFGSWTSYDLLG